MKPFGNLENSATQHSPLLPLGSFGWPPQNYRQLTEIMGGFGVNPKWGMLLFRALGNLWDEGKEQRNFG